MGTSTAGLEGVIAGESEICYIDGYQGVLSYRGYNIHTLADHATFEEVVFLLWKGWLPKQDELDRLKRDFLAERELPEPVTADQQTIRHHKIGADTAEKPFRSTHRANHKAPVPVASQSVG